MRVFRGSRLQRNGYIGKKDWSCAGTEYGALESKESDKAVVSIKGLLSDITQDHVRTRRSASLAFDVPSIGTIRCTQVFRAILGKRIVCLGQAEGDQVIVKLYFDPQRARIHWRRSDEGSRAFLDRFIASPKILFSGYLVKYDLYAIVFEYIKDAVRLDKALADAPSGQDRQQLLDRLLVCLADQHRAGIIQADLHMGNFLVTAEDIYSLDGDQVRTSARPVGKRLSSENLVELFSRLWPVYDTELPKYYRLYCSKRGYEITEKDIQKLIGMVKRVRNRHLAKYMRKIFRSQDPFLVRKTHGCFSVCDLRVWDDGFAAVCRNPENFISEDKNQKMERACSNYVVTDSGPLILHSSRTSGKPLLRRCGIIARRWKNAHRLNRLGIRTPRPIALIVKRGPDKRLCSYMIEASCEGTLARDFFASDTIPNDEKHSAAEHIAKAFFVMKQTGISIQGMHGGNILISDLKPIFLNGTELNRVPFARRFGAEEGVSDFLRGWDDNSDILLLFLERFRQLQLM